MGQGGKKGKRGTGLPPEEIRLWKAYTRDIDPLHAEEENEMEAADTPTSSILKPEPRKSLIRPAVRLPSVTPVQPPQLDGSTAKKLKKGDIGIDGRLDLHGCTQEQAHRLLEDFVAAAHAKGKRCLLVITGKGSRAGQSEGVLKQKVPQWLQNAHPAAAKHGGSGALYVYLKRVRERD
jgi:DNA-nicking Smr family endonuclease